MISSATSAQKRKRKITLHLLGSYRLQYEYPHLYQNIFGFVWDFFSFALSVKHSWSRRQHRSSFFWSSCPLNLTASGHGWSCSFLSLSAGCSQASPHQTLLIHRQKQVNLKESSKNVSDMSVYRFAHSSISLFII